MRWISLLVGLGSATACGTRAQEDARNAPPPPSVVEAGAASDARPAEDATTPSGGDADTEAPATPTVSCATYCATMSANCTVANAMYTDATQCAMGCVSLTLGTLGETADSVGCRLAQANDGGALHCAAAGPFGGDVCGTHCEAFCQLALATCPGVFADAKGCSAACQTWVRAPMRVHATGPTSGDTFDCRAYHLSAAISAPSVHCTHIGESSPPCR